MTFFNPKLLREVKHKLGELEKNKASWISKDRLKYEGIPCLLKEP
jgi:hypothetical protein